MGARTLEVLVESYVALGSLMCVLQHDCGRSRPRADPREHALHTNICLSGGERSPSDRPPRITAPVKSLSAHTHAHTHGQLPPTFTQNNSKTSKLCSPNVFSCDTLFCGFGPIRDSPLFLCVGAD